ncbi:hypothetical protein TanjilG_25363 [Lupinus angustifolius]|uniref:ENTH domain-containing protein n=1 Tax=Lupinus angustifolius TaxID=3871 RepID=A0A4P1RV40_LUPAN|nr:PREDICTED: putative clathrin assembly protein At1g25240 [Lupinus angustifolius]OIW18920.1 hypothetical protein TanjilG_25363 [Lupinus angustifolius]
MRLWKKASGLLKDKNSIIVARFSGNGPFRNPDLETVIIKATSHDEQKIDCKNVQRVFHWIRVSPLYLKPLVMAISIRVRKTRSWVVALKGLVLMHGVFTVDIPVVQRMGKLPFDLSNFSDGHMSPEKAWGFNAFVRAYFAYLDQRSCFVSYEAKKMSNRIKQRNHKDAEVEETLMEELEKLQKLQGLIDRLMQIKPGNMNMNVGLILEAMDCVIVEVFDIYSKFCKMIAKVLLRIYDIGGKVEAGIGLNVLQKATIQGDELTLYIEFCRQIGVLNASQCPKIQRIPEEDIQDLENIISGAFHKKKMEGNGYGYGGVNNEDKAIVVVRNCENDSENGLTTVITHQWEVFDDKENNIVTTINPFEESSSYKTLVPSSVQNQIVLPDLISF